jgi:hypothetical protein
MGAGSSSLALLLALGCAAIGGPAAAATVETLLMPGPVIQAHADVEDDCAACHSPFDREAEDGLCLECHAEVEEDRVSKTGFHFRAPGVYETPCRSCHTDHGGRNADVVGLNPALFDHEHTDYTLRGAHGVLDCAQCHADEKHRDAPSDCVGCHREDDRHRTALGETCGDCHTEASWAEARFEHAETDFPLEGAHVDVRCASCHADERYEATPSDCGSCHRLDDVHQGRFGTACETCHSASAWEEPGFDHGRDTHFPLEGRHAAASCASCHPRNPYTEPAPTDCSSCHGEDDVHRGRNGSDCSTCHGADAWSRVLFDHDRDTTFPLRGGHSEVRCESCHVGNVYGEELASTCVTCHQEDDVHAGQQDQRCETCHGENSWHGDVLFDHGLARFPLLGLHATVACEECHASATFQDAPTDCVDCHLRSDVHEDRLGHDCARCHTPNAWPVWRFDHDAESTFALHGSHQDLDCLGCHVAPLGSGEIVLRQTCAPCHEADDVHRGAFGSDCARCHGEATWGDLKALR